MILRRYEQADQDEVWMLHKTAMQEVGAYLGSGPWDDELHQSLTGTSRVYRHKSSFPSLRDWGISIKVFKNNSNVIVPPIENTCTNRTMWIFML
jgi:hypothetical protein